MNKLSKKIALLVLGASVAGMSLNLKAGFPMNHAVESSSPLDEVAAPTEVASTSTLRNVLVPVAVVGGVTVAVVAGNVADQRFNGGKALEAIKRAYSALKAKLSKTEQA